MSTNYLEEAFIITLIVLSSPAEKQIECIGEDFAVADEIAEDFSDYMTVLKQQNYFNNNKYFAVKEDLDLIYKILDENSGQWNEEFWTINSLRTHPLWEKLRCMMKEVLKKIEKDNLDILIHRKNNWTKLELIKKNKPEQ